MLPNPGRDWSSCCISCQAEDLNHGQYNHGVWTTEQLTGPLITMATALFQIWDMWLCLQSRWHVMGFPMGFPPPH